MNQQRLAMIAIGTAVTAIAAVRLFAGDPDRAAITVYRDGRASILGEGGAAHTEVRQSVIDLLLAKNKNGIPEVVTDQTIQQAKQQTEAVEVVLPRSKGIVIPESGSKVSRILVVIKGARYQGWIFYGDQKYGSGPFLSGDSSVLGRLSELLEKTK